MKALKYFVIVVLLIVVAAMALSSCGDDDDDDKSSRTSESSETKETNTPKKEFSISYSTEYSKEYDKTVEDGTKLTEKELPTLQYKDYEFLGWYIGSERISVGYVVTSNLTLTAKWKLPEDEVVNTAFTITFTSDYGKTPHSITVEKGQKITSKDLPELTASGYTFVGWFSGDEQIEVGYKVVSDMDLIAKWDEANFAITYTSKYGEAPANKKVETGRKLSIDDLPNLSDEFHSFLGWYDGDEKINIGYEVAGNLNLTSKWCHIYADISERNYPDVNEYIGKHFRLQCSNHLKFNEYNYVDEDKHYLIDAEIKNVNVEYIDIFFCGGKNPIRITLLDSDFNSVMSNIKSIDKENDWVYSLELDEKFACRGYCGFSHTYFVTYAYYGGDYIMSGYYCSTEIVATNLEVCVFVHNGNLYIGYGIVEWKPCAGDFIIDGKRSNPYDIVDEEGENDTLTPIEYQKLPPVGASIDYTAYINDNGIILDSMGNIRYVQAENFIYPVYVLEEVK